jgi:large subunit ribosomal protein L17
VCSLIEHSRIQTTIAKAKVARRYADKMITLAKKGTLHHRRQAIAFLRHKPAVEKLFAELGKQHGDRNGGYTRIVRIGQRLGDAAEIAILEWTGTVTAAPEPEEGKKAEEPRLKETKVAKLKKKAAGKKEEGAASVISGCDLARGIWRKGSQATVPVGSNVAAIVLVLGVVAFVLTGEVDLVFFGVGFVEVGGGHLQDLGDGDEEVQQIDDFHACVLFVELLVFRPPLPGNAIGQLGDFLRHGAAIIEHPLLALFLGHGGGVHAEALVELLLQAKDMFQFIGCAHI